MSTLSILYLDNDQYAYKIYSDQIREYWFALYGYRPNIDHVETIEAALGKLAQRPLPYQMLIADLLFPPLNDPAAPTERHVPRGLEVIREASRRDKLLILAVSQGKPDGAPRLGEDAIREGAHIFRFRGEVADPMGPGIRGLCKELHELLVRHEILPDNLLFEYDSGDPRLSVIVTDITKPTLKALAKAVLSPRAEPDRLVARYIAPGMSGAYVLKVEAYQKQRPRTNYLLKISRSRERLLREIHNYPQGVYSNRLLVKYLPLPEQGLSQVKEWLAIAADFEEDAKTLKQWLSIIHNGDVASVFRTLFLAHGLTNGYRDNLNTGAEQLSALGALLPNESRSARIVDAMNELDPLAASSEFGGDASWPERAKELRLLLSRKRFRALDPDDYSRPCFMCQSHGDLHSRNILVTDAGGPLLIDTADCSVLHWASDYVRLLVDLVVAVYDHGVSSHRWSTMSHWRDVARAVSSLDVLPFSAESSLDEANSHVRTGIAWLIAHVREICPAIASETDFAERKWELELALGIEFLRSSYRTDLSPPKRVLGLLAGHAVLVEASKAIEGGQK